MRSIYTHQWMLTDYFETAKTDCNGPFVLVWKKDKFIEFCIDFKKNIEDFSYDILKAIIYLDKSSIFDYLICGQVWTSLDSNAPVGSNIQCH